MKTVAMSSDFVYSGGGSSFGILPNRALSILSTEKSSMTDAK